MLRRAAAAKPPADRAEEDALLDAFGLLVQRRGRDRLRLLLVGGVLEGERFRELQRAMRARAQALGLGDRIRWSGSWAWDSDRGSRLLRATDACALPFDGGAETRHCSIATVLDHERPLVTTTGPFAAPHFVDGQNALLVPPQDPAALACAVERLIDDPALSQKLRQGGAALARACFSWDAVLGSTLAALRRPPSR